MQFHIMQFNYHNQLGRLFIQYIEKNVNILFIPMFSKLNIQSLIHIR